MSTENGKHIENIIEKKMENMRGICVCGSFPSLSLVCEEINGNSNRVEERKHIHKGSSGLA